MWRHQLIRRCRGSTRALSALALITGVVWLGATALPLDWQAWIGLTYPAPSMLGEIGQTMPIRTAAVASAAASTANLGWNDDDRWLLALPVAHVGGLSVVTRCLIARRTDGA